MRVPENIRKCVGFVAYHDHKINDLRLVGTAFFLGDEVEGGKASPVYVITAKHVIEGLREKGVTEVLITVNVHHSHHTKAYMATQTNEWYFHPTDVAIDVAIISTGLHEICDQLVCPTSLCMTEEKWKAGEIGLGDEVFITGLFRPHTGSKRNIPIVRVGNLAALDEEKVNTQEYGEIDAYLVEARSIGGLSGSPVFLNLGIMRMIGGQLKHFQGQETAFTMLGLVHGHYDSKEYDGDANDLTDTKINMGIAIIVPMYNIFKVIRKFETQEREKKKNN